MSAGHGHGHGGGQDHHSGNKGVALLISVLALVLAFAETLGKSAQTGALAYNIEASNLWAFFQAKTIRQTVLRTAAEEAQAGNPSEGQKKQVAKWLETAQRYQSEPDTGEGREQLAARAKEAEKKRDTSMAAYHHYEMASAAVQIENVGRGVELLQHREGDLVRAQRLAQPRDEHDDDGEGDEQRAAVPVEE